MRLRALAGVALAGLLVSGQKCSDLEKRVCNERPNGKLVNRDGQIKCEYPTTTTTTSTTTSTLPPTTTTTLPPRPFPTPTIPPPAPPETPLPACALPPMPECGRSEGPTGVYGCCWTDKARPLPHSPFNQIVEAEQDAIAAQRPDLFDRDGRANEDDYVSFLVWRLQQKGLCVTRGGPSDEIGLKQTNGESYQYDVHLGNGRPRLSGYTAYCSPARFDD